MMEPTPSPAHHRKGTVILYCWSISLPVTPPQPPPVISSASRYSPRVWELARKGFQAPAPGEVKLLVWNQGCRWHSVWRTSEGPPISLSPGISGLPVMVIKPI
jgi:hypothetical protein